MKAMTPKILPKSALPAWIRSLSADQRVIGPAIRPAGVVFDEVHSADEVAWEYTTTILPPKKAFLPPRETLLRFQTDRGLQLEAQDESRPTVLLGIHTCDLHAMGLLDRVFREGLTDQHYARRRELTCVVSLECLRPCTSQAFCKSMGTLGLPEAFDLHLTDIGEEYVADVGSEKGAALLAGLHSVRDASAGDLGQLERVMSTKWSSFSYALEFDAAELPGLLSLARDSDLWRELGERCLACGACTLVCPTCHCFDVQDETDFSLQAGRRTRVWDSCQLPLFARVSGGHDFREGQAARLRHRFFRKGKYQVEAYGLTGCVGCGRCAQACLVHISPVEVFNELHRRHAEAPQAQEVAA
jgi:sulfhydrogenase subunit beta (sulfur reductase)